MLNQSFILFCSLILFAVSEAIAAPPAEVKTAKPAPVVSEQAEDVTEEEVTPDPFYEIWNKEGWYWNKMQAEKEKKKPEKKALIPPPLSTNTIEKIWNMHPDAFQELLMAYQKKAVQTPSEDNVKDYYTMQDVARRKALAFTNVAMVVWQKNPELFVLKDYPTNNPGNTSMVRQKREDIEGKIRQNKDNFALVYFYSTTCDYCAQQSQILKHFENKYGWVIKGIDVNKNPEVAERFGATSVPMIIMVYRNTQEHMPVAAGVAAVNEIEENLYRGIRLMSGEITAEQYSVYDFQGGSSVDPVIPVPKPGTTVEASIGLER